MKFSKIVILTILILIIGSWCNVMADEFISIPSYLTDNTEVTNIQPMAAECTGCLDFCEVYDECCNYENCQSYCTNNCQDGCEVSCETTCETTCQTCLTSQNPAESATLTISNISKTYCTATVSGLEPNGTVLRVEFYANSVLKQTAFTSSSSSVSVDITGLSAGNSYTIQAKIYNNSTGSLLKTLSKTVTTDSNPTLPTPTLDTSATVKTANSITVTINPVSGANSYYFRINGGSIINNSVVRTHTFSDLLPNTQYYIEIKVGGTGYIDSDWAGYYATTLVAVLWEWWTPKTESNLGVTPDEWLAFCNKINEVRVANGLTAYSFTTSTDYIGTNKKFYAWIWLQAANAINDLGTGVAADCLNVKSFLDSMNSDSLVYPWYWDNLKTALNNAIN